MPSSCPLHPERRVETFFFSILTNQCHPSTVPRADGREPALSEVEGTNISLHIQCRRATRRVTCAQFISVPHTPPASPLAS